MLLTGVPASGGQYTLLYWAVIFLGIVVVLFSIRRSGNKRLAQMQQRQEQLKASLTPGTWVRTSSGFYGKVVEFTGEIVTLSNLTGEETLWDIRAISEVKEPDFGSAAESGGDLAGSDSVILGRCAALASENSSDSGEDADTNDDDTKKDVTDVNSEQDKPKDTKHEDKD